MFKALFLIKCVPQHLAVSCIGSVVYKLLSLKSYLTENLKRSQNNLGKDNYVLAWVGDVVLNGMKYGGKMFVLNLIYHV